MLKVGHDHFELTHLAPKVDVCERRYVFDAETSAGFSPLDRCPVYKMREDVEAAVREKQRRDEVETARLIGAGIPIAPTNGGQGGMNRIFLAAISQAGAGVAIRTPAGTIPSHVHPPSRTASQGTDTRAAEPSAASENGLVNSGTATSADQIGTLLSDRLQ
jgi:hypothetical protein